MKYLIPLLLLFGCSLTKKSDEKLNPNPDLTIEEKARDYCEDSKVLEDEYGFVGSCGDQVLFNSLRSTSCNNGTQIYKAENPAIPGEWFRDGKRACKIPEQTKTRFSRDMAIGLMFYLWQQHDAKALQEIEELITYSKNKGWYLCDAPEPLRTSRCYVNPNLKGTMYELAYQLGGTDNKARKVPYIPSEPAIKVTGFEAHLSVLHILLRGMMTGSITFLQKEALRYQKNREPRNLLFRTAFAKFDDGNMANIVNELKAMKEFPDDRLPDTFARCEPYLWQRDFGDDWKPCAGALTHPGIDYTFLVALINDKVRHSKQFTTPDGEFEYKERH